MKPAASLVLVQVVFAVMNIFYKLALNDGMDVRVLVAYRYLFATVFLGPLAFFLERYSALASFLFLFLLFPFYFLREREAKALSLLLKK